MLAAHLAFGASWVSLGPEGGDARSLAYDPSSPDRVYLGTSSGELFLSTDGGATWSRLAHLGADFDYVLDSISVDPKDPRVIYVGAWSIENSHGDVFKSTDRGQNWHELPGIHGKSVRALAIAPSESNVVVAGALDGVYRSADAGQTWTKITPPDNPELKNFESVAIDPRSSQVVYAGTWHLPWKTDDGGKTWSNIKTGIIDDSDVFSIIVDNQSPNTVYVSACSGIYKSDTAGATFRKVQGIPFSARRTRKLQQDPIDRAIVYAGTTEGLWHTKDSGVTWARISPASFIVNDVMVDPRDPSHVLVATDRSGILVSHDRGTSFQPSNHGFSHRQVTALVADREHPERLYAALINNREYGGIYRSEDGGSHWEQLDNGLGTRDIFSLEQAESGQLIAGTNQGIFALETNGSVWKPINVVLTEKFITAPNRHRRKKSDPETKIRREWAKSEMTGRVFQVKLDSGKWFAATSQGFYRSLDTGKSWTGGSVMGHKQFVSVAVHGDSVLASSPEAVLLSRDGGNGWEQLTLPPFVSRIYRVEFGPNDSSVWISTHMGTFHSKDAGKTWEHVMAGQPLSNVAYISYDRQNARLLAVADARRRIYESRDGDQWTLAADSHWPIRNLVVTRGHLYAVTDFSGIVEQPLPAATATSSGGGNRP
ncbi:MAG: WD40/YVTN/BNR-like repeat-containing protein [Terriglobales bacterium]